MLKYLVTFITFIHLYSVLLWYTFTLYIISITLYIISITLYIISINLYIISTILYIFSIFFIKVIYYTFYICIISMLC